MCSKADGQGKIYLSDVSQDQKIKNHMLSLICDYRPKTNTVMVLDMGHTLRGEHTLEE
jgi:hypothetical protein